MLEIKIDLNTSEPLYQQISEQVKLLISGGQLKPGEQIPSVRDLASWLQLNPSTVARAYFNLKEEGLVTTSRRRGTVVLDSHIINRNQKVPATQYSAISDNNLLHKIEVSFTQHPAIWHIQKSI